MKSSLLSHESSAGNFYAQRMFTSKLILFLCMRFKMSSSPNENLTPMSVIWDKQVPQLAARS